MLGYCTNTTRNNASKDLCRQYWECFHTWTGESESASERKIVQHRQTHCVHKLASANLSVWSYFTKVKSDIAETVAMQVARVSSQSVILATNVEGSSITEPNAVGTRNSLSLYLMIRPTRTIVEAQLTSHDVAISRLASLVCTQDRRRAGTQTWICWCRQ